MTKFLLILSCFAAAGCSKGDPAQAAGFYPAVTPGAMMPGPPGLTPSPASPAAPPSSTQSSGQGATELSAFERSVAAGKRVYVRNLNGSIRAEGHDGNKVEVRAEKRERGDHSPANVKIQVVDHDGTFTVCAVWPAQNSVCGPNGAYQHDGVSANSTQVRISILVPRGVEIDLGTVNGSAKARGVDAAVIAHSVNGKVRVDTKRGKVDASSVNGGVRVKTGDGPVQAKSVNGSIDIEIGKLSRPETMELGTVNGSISARFPPGFGAELQASVLNGRIEADLPIGSVKSMGKRHLHAVLGQGGPLLKATTTNGSIRLGN